MKVRTKRTHSLPGISDLHALWMQAPPRFLIRTAPLSFLRAAVPIPAFRAEFRLARKMLQNRRREAIRLPLAPDAPGHFLRLDLRNE